MRLESFIGKATLAVDGAGRTNLPKEFRKVLSDEAKGHVVVTLGGGSTLALYPLPEWGRYVQSLENLGRGPDVSKFRTRITAMAKYSVLDAQNRITLTPEQLRYAGIQGEVTFVGDCKRIRLWAPERYAAEIESVTPEEAARFENWF
jgi:division/cell wall cluster transcriptional repressor MraZ